MGKCRLQGRHWYQCRDEPVMVSSSNSVKEITQGRVEESQQYKTRIDTENRKPNNQRGCISSVLNLVTSRTRSLFEKLYQFDVRHGVSLFIETSLTILTSKCPCSFSSGNKSKLPGRAKPYQDTTWIYVVLCCANFLKLTSGRQKFETYCKTDKVPIEANTPPPYLSTKPQRTKIKQQRRAPTHLNMQAKYCVLQVNGNHPVAKNFANK
uniref:Uncharacterized protein n=1 Tax=Glossina austeni TaxID=7395 RepID=A0A1A9VS30_GLOAU